MEASEGFLISLYKNQGEKRLIATLRKLELDDQREGREEMACWQMAYKNEKIFLRIWVWRFVLLGGMQALSSYFNNNKLLCNPFYSPNIALEKYEYNNTLIGTLSSQGIMKLIVLLWEFIQGLPAEGSYLLTHGVHYPIPFKTVSFISGNCFNSSLSAYSNQF